MTCDCDICAMWFFSHHAVLLLVLLSLTNCCVGAWNLPSPRPSIYSLFGGYILGGRPSDISNELLLLNYLRVGRAT